MLSHPGVWLAISRRQTRANSLPTITSYLNGAKAGMPGGNPSPAKRGVVNGWSSAAVRRHTQWLYSVDALQLTDEGYAVTLTVRDCPPSALEFHAARRAYIKRLTRMGVTRIHWVIEWQRRRVPHMHLAVYFATDAEASASAPTGSKRAALVDAWLEVAAAFAPSARSQYVLPITGHTGWSRYLSKHAARGAAHYQRQGKPPGWEKTGRLWGFTGDWPAMAPMRHVVSREAFWRYRRLVRAWRVADARAASDPARIKFARRMLACPLPKLSAVRGTSEWIPEDINAGFLALLASEGHLMLDPDVSQVAPSS